MPAVSPETILTITPQAYVLGLSAIAAGIAMLTGIGVSISQGMATRSALESIARQPEAKGDLQQTLFIGLAMQETSIIFPLIIAILLVVVNPLVGML
ncbi:MAG: ATP synthase F0 subunit C [Clostridiales bacterium]|nr:ATP synthase F0 subunit C [Clostridiales bacterium]